MKDFTKDYSETIATAILKKYNINNGFCKPLNAYIISKGKRDCLSIRSNENAHYFGIVKESKKAFLEISKYAEMVETYNGELENWKYQEEQRVYNKARDIIIETLAYNNVV